MNVHIPNPGSVPMIRPFPPSTSCDGPSHPYTPKQLKDSDREDTLPLSDSPTLPTPNNNDTEDSHLDSAAGQTTGVMADNDARLSDKPITNAFNTTEENSNRDGNPTGAMASSKLETLRLQGQALNAIAQTLLMQIQALNTQIDSLL